MIRRINYVIILLLVCFFADNSMAYDSLSLEVKKGKWVVGHKVDAGETLFSISQRYEAEIDAIIELNGIEDYTISVGSVIYIPYPTAGEKYFHVVEEGQTMFSISRQYDVSVSEIMKWNGLEGYDLNVGQNVLVYLPPDEDETPTVSREGYHTVQPGETLFSISQQYGVSVDDIKRWNDLSTNEISQGQSIAITGPGIAVTAGAVVASNEVLTENTPVQEVIELPYNPKLAQMETIAEEGMAELIGGTSSNGKFLALHKTVPSGTILCVKNELNHQAVFVRVVGKIPDTSENARVVVKISDAAYDQLGAVNPKFRVVVTRLK